MDRLRKLTPTHVALCALVFAATVVVLIVGVGLAGITVVVIACLLMMVAMLWLLMGGGLGEGRG